jgi:hypothetical protein
MQSGHKYLGEDGLKLKSKCRSDFYTLLTDLVVMITYLLGYTVMQLFFFYMVKCPAADATDAPQP